jgi:hypothetical protein
MTFSFILAMEVGSKFINLRLHKFPSDLVCLAIFWGSWFWIVIDWFCEVGSPLSRTRKNTRTRFYK